MEVNIHPSWKRLLKSEFKKDYFKQLVTFLKTEKAQKKTIYPPGPLIFNAFDLTPFENVSVVIIGQDPYHGHGQAHGLSFSVPPKIKVPRSLANIFKEIQNDIGIQMNLENGDLTTWAKQGVLLLNAALTVRAAEPMSHAQFGWNEFTNAVIQLISDHKKGVVFILWGKFAQEKKILINDKNHFVLTAAHPSPFSAEKGFFGCKHFSKTNLYLTKNGSTPINWKN